MELAIDTSTDTASLALAHQGQVLAELTWHAGRNHTVELMPNLVHLLRQARIGIQELDALVVARGPGSFNGLRVGMSTAKGLAFALSLPLVGVSTLEVEAFPYATCGMPVCALLGAGRGEVAAAIFHRRRGKWQRLLEEHITTIEALSLHIAGRTLFCGELSPEVAAHLKKALGRRALVVGEAGRPRRAGYLAALGWQRIQSGHLDDPATLQPLYHRRPSVTIKQGRSALRQALATASRSPKASRRGDLRRQGSV